MRVEINGVILECRKGNIVYQPDVDAIVNSANSALAPGSGVAGAMHRAAGPELYEECMLLAPIVPGEAVITAGYNLPNTRVIHCLGPVYNKDRSEDELLGSCYKECLKIADNDQLTSIAFCAISTGVFAYPVEIAAEIAFKSIVEHLPQLSSIKLIRFVLFSENDLQAHEQALKKII